jgi:hypothetical protein
VPIEELVDRSPEIFLVISSLGDDVSRFGISYQGHISPKHPETVVQLDHLQNSGFIVIATLEQEGRRDLVQMKDRREVRVGAEILPHIPSKVAASSSSDLHSVLPP